MSCRYRVISIFGLLLVLCGCEKSADNRFDQLDVLRRALSGEPSTLDPAAAADNFSSEVLRDIYEGLTVESPTGEVGPGVASSWRVDPSGRQYTFNLRPDARWSNGKQVTAQDFVRAWRRVVDPKQGSPVADDFRFLVGAASIIEGKMSVDELGVYAADDKTLIVNLVQPVPYLPQLLTHAATYPIYSDASAHSHDALVSVTNGPYSLKSWLPSTAIQLVKNENYWDHTNVRISRVEYDFITDESVQYAGFRAGQIDITDTVPPNVLPQLRDVHSPDLVVAPFLATAYYGLNLAKPPFDANLKLREALAMAIDRRKLVHALAAGQVEAFGFVPPGVSNYTPQAWSWNDLDPSQRVAEARRLYNEAGFSQEKRLHLSLLINSNIGIKNTALIVASMWKDVLGIDVELTEEEYRVFLQSRHEKTRWDVVRLGWVADYNDASNFLDPFREHSINNDEGYANHIFDSLLDNAAHTQDFQKRREILETSERTMLADYPVIPLYFFVSKRLVKPYVRGLKSNPLNHISSKSLYMVSR